MRARNKTGWACIQPLRHGRITHRIGSAIYRVTRKITTHHRSRGVFLSQHTVGQDVFQLACCLSHESSSATRSVFGCSYEEQKVGLEGGAAFAF